MRLEERLFTIFDDLCGIRLPWKTVNFVPMKFDLAIKKQQKSLDNNLKV